MKVFKLFLEHILQGVEQITTMDRNRLTANIVLNYIYMCVKRMHMDGKVLVAPSFDQGIQKTFPLGTPCFPLTVNLHGNLKLPTARLGSADATKGSIHGSLLLGRQVLQERVKHGAYRGFLRETFSNYRDCSNLFWVWSLHQPCPSGAQAFSSSSVASAAGNACPGNGSNKLH